VIHKIQELNTHKYFVVNNIQLRAPKVTVRNLTLTDWVNGIYYYNVKGGVIVGNIISSNEPLSTATLNWNGVNETMQGSGTSWHLNKTGLAEETYTFRVYGNDSAGNMNKTETRIVTVSLPVGTPTPTPIPTPEPTPIPEFPDFALLLAIMTVFVVVWRIRK
jgi:hypothetical protein